MEPFSYVASCYHLSLFWLLGICSTCLHLGNSQLCESYWEARPISHDRRWKRHIVSLRLTSWKPGPVGCFPGTLTLEVREAGAVMTHSGGYERHKVQVQRLWWGKESAVSAAGGGTVPTGLTRWPDFGCDYSHQPLSPLAPDHFLGLFISIPCCEFIAVNSCIHSSHPSFFI